MRRWLFKVQVNQSRYWLPDRDSKKKKKKECQEIFTLERNIYRNTGILKVALGSRMSSKEEELVSGML